MARVSIGYSVRQIGLHWLVFLLVAYQWFTGDFMTMQCKQFLEDQGVELVAPYQIAGKTKNRIIVFNS